MSVKVVWGIVYSNGSSSVAVRSGIAVSRVGGLLTLVMELKPKPSLKQIQLPKELNDKNLRQPLLMLPNDSRLWGITKTSVLAEIAGKYETVAITPEPYQISRYLNKESGNEAIAFDVIDNKTESYTTYYIKQTSPTAKCEATFNPNKPLLLVGDEIRE